MDQTGKILSEHSETLQHPSTTIMYNEKYTYIFSEKRNLKRYSRYHSILKQNNIDSLDEAIDVNYKQVIQEVLGGLDRI